MEYILILVVSFHIVGEHGIRSDSSLAATSQMIPQPSMATCESEGARLAREVAKSHTQSSRVFNILATASAHCTKARWF